MRPPSSLVQRNTSAFRHRDLDALLVAARLLNMAVKSSAKQKMPGFIEPELAQLEDRTPSGPVWVHEIKFDGYRTQIRVENGKVTASTRRGYDWSKRFGRIIKAATALPDCIIDGEAVVLDGDGKSSFSLLQSALSSGNSAPITYFAFDLLFLRGRDLRSLPLTERKSQLADILRRAGSSLAKTIQYVQHFEAPGQEMHERACALGLEGVVSKRKDSRYRSVRSDDWIKSKCGERETLIVGGWRETVGGIQSIALGQFRRSGEFEYVGKARAGFHGIQAQIKPALLKAEIPTMPFTKGKPERKPGQHWTRPVLQAEVTFTAWTASGHVRHAIFKGLREDMPIVAKRASNPRKHVIPGRSEILVGAPVPPDDELKAYWRKVGKKALTYLGRRPLKLVRHEKGRVFYHCSRPLPQIPKTIHRLTVEKRSGGEGTRLWVDNIAGLVALVDIGVIEVHPWASTVDDLEHPDFMVFDLDPGDDVEWDFVKDTALELRDYLRSEEGLGSWPKATGGKGLHVMVPLDRSRTHDEVRQYSRQIAEAFAGKDRRYTTSAALAKRPGHLFLDYLRNGRGTTAVGVYSPRARPSFPIAIPLTWRQVEQGVKSDATTIED